MQGKGPNSVNVRKPQMPDGTQSSVSGPIHEVFESTRRGLNNTTQLMNQKPLKYGSKLGQTMTRRQGSQVTAATTTMQNRTPIQNSGFSKQYGSGYVIENDLSRVNASDTDSAAPPY